MAVSFRQFVVQLDIAPIHIDTREIDVALAHHDVVAFRQCHAVPNRLRHQSYSFMNLIAYGFKAPSTLYRLKYPYIGASGTIFLEPRRLEIFLLRRAL